MTSSSLPCRQRNRSSHNESNESLEIAEEAMTKRKKVLWKDTKMNKTNSVYCLDIINPHYVVALWLTNCREKEILAAKRRFVKILP